ncbi:MAG: ParB family transcriptional regulator, chromosome partitioning protein [Petroclostridium sp.]|uniref:ParB/RepB/Spo0J family partition protein n=1 Tax=Petroclostridium xylanilyticum TaxID=1792311 RepID=UPI000B97DA8A|nr:ParB/RepB/Spo0J family partition protein [Petroclostridium xylanilyticum]MBZ4646152.1 parB-like protein partition protein [Clostridia bacterium]MDK2810440.1 ParB family transcriptional regulator, chromosome partitioning protein [Petroclostridium sp.]
MVKRGLGKGLGALLPGVDTEEDSPIKEIKLTEIEPNKSQPRKNFDEEKLEALAESIKTHGVIQPIIVKKLESGFYQIIAGERRWRAARLAGLKTIPVIIKDYEKKEVLEIALIENLQREDLNPIEESEAYQNLINEFNLTQEEISARVGKSRSAIANALRLLNLPEGIKQLLIEDKISSGHARAILSIDNIELQIQVANKVVNEGLSVRETEKYVKALVSQKSKKNKKDNKLSHVYIDIQNRMSQNLGTKVRIYPGANKSKIEIEYYSDDDLERIMNLLKC